MAAQSDSFFFFGRKIGEEQVKSMIFFMWFFNGEGSEPLWAIGAGTSIFPVWSREKRSGSFWR